MMRAEDVKGDNSHLYHFTHAKAGTDLSQQHRKGLNNVIHEMSKDSRLILYIFLCFSYFKHAKDNDKRTQEKILNIKHQIEILSSVFYFAWFYDFRETWLLQSYLWIKG